MKAALLFDRLGLNLLDFDVDTARQVEAHQRVDCLVGGIEDVDQAVVRSEFKVLHRLLVDVRTPDDAKASKVGRKGDRAADAGTCSLGAVYDFLGRLIDQSVIVGTQTNANFDSTGHDKVPSTASSKRPPEGSPQSLG